MSKLLDRIDSPADLKKLTITQLPQLAQEIREFMIEVVSHTGGHLAANLGTVELTIALLKVFNPPVDKLLWDVSHQTYTYKILTGRKDRFSTLRQTGGLSGYQVRAESAYDAFGAGHAGTALSAAIGIAVARDRKRGAEHIVAIVGDGALSCGSSFEALNNLDLSTHRLIVVVNDNEMSISANVGSISSHLGHLLAHPRYNRWKTSVEQFAKARLGLTRLRQVYWRAEEAIKGLFLHSVFFEEFGLRYIGPVEGHNLYTLISALEIAKRSDKPILLHVSTQKGKGYTFAEQEPAKWHGTNPFNSKTGKLVKSGTGLTYSQVFGKTLERLAEKNEKLMVITPAMSIGSGLSTFERRFPARFFDVGISEEHAIIFAAGLASEGCQPVVSIYSTFAQRAVDYVIHDVCLQQLPVVLCIDRAGIVGDDGPTHHGVFDIALFRSIPNLVIMQPANEAELANMLYSALHWAKPAIIRYPRGTGPGASIPEHLEEIPFGKAEVLHEGADIQIWALGDMLPVAEKIANSLKPYGLQCGVVYPRFITPLDHKLLGRHAASAQLIVTLENGVVTGGFGTSVMEWLSGFDFKGRILRFGWPQEFVPHGSVENLFTAFGLNHSAILKTILKAIHKETPA